MTAAEDTTTRKMRQLEEDNISLREDLRRLRADLDVLRSGRLGTLGFRKTALVGDNALATSKYQDGSVTPAKLSDGISRTKLEATESETITVESGAGYSFPQFQITELGVQILADDASTDPPLFLLIVPEYVDDLGYAGGQPLPDVDYWSGVVGNADDSDNYIQLIARNYTGNLTTWFARVNAYADVSNAFVELRAQNNAGTVTEAQLNAYSSGLGTFYLTDCMIVLDSETSDPSANLFDGALLYRSDTDKFRARVNGAWVNLLTSADTVGGWPLTINSGTGDITAADKQLVLYKGTGGHTVTLPASPLASDVFVVVKNFGSGNVTVDGDGADTIDGALTVVLAPYDSVTLHTESATGNWYVI